MDVLLAQVTSQAMSYAIRSGIAITSGYAIKQCGRLLSNAPRSEVREELIRLQLRLQSRICVISPSIDMIEIIAARGNTSLDPAVTLTRDIRYQIQRLAIRLSHTIDGEEPPHKDSSRARSSRMINLELSGLILEMKSLLARIEDAVPLINLAITTSGVNLSTRLSGSVSPSRLLQASTFLTAADAKYTEAPYRRQQVGPVFTLSLYMLFAAHARPTDKQGTSETTWKEVLHKARVKLCRVPLDEVDSVSGPQPFHGVPPISVPADNNASEFAYQLSIVEDLDDGRLHTFDENTVQNTPVDDVVNAGIRDVIPVHQISKVFYADTGRVLKIGGEGETNDPVLLLKRDVSAEAPRQMLQQWRSLQDLSDQEIQLDAQVHGPPIGAACEGEQTSCSRKRLEETVPGSECDHEWRLPKDLDPEWIALGVYSEPYDSDSDDASSSENETPSAQNPSSLEPDFASDFAKLAIHSSPTTSSPARHGHSDSNQERPLTPVSPREQRRKPIKTSLSLLEMLIKLAALQQFRQESHLAIEDEFLSAFLDESGTAGAGADQGHRQRTRQAAIRRVGFDPYDESPLKRRDKRYVQHRRRSPYTIGHDLCANSPMPQDDAGDLENDSTVNPAHPPTLVPPTAEPNSSAVPLATSALL